MGKCIFWNTYRLGTGSRENKKMLLEGVLAQMMSDDAADYSILCEITGAISIGDVRVEKGLVKASRTAGQLAYYAFADDCETHDLELAKVGDFREVFRHASHKKGGSTFSKISKRPVACVVNGGEDETSIYAYHANASSRAAFLVAWVAESLHQAHDGNFVLFGDLNCQPDAFVTELQTCTGDNAAPNRFTVASGGATHNARDGMNLSSTYDWAIAGSTITSLNVATFDCRDEVKAMELKRKSAKRKGDSSKDEKDNEEMDIDPLSDHLPILVSW